MNNLLKNLFKGATNPHIAIPVVLSLCGTIAKAALPDQATAIDVVQKLLIGYAVSAAANSSPASVATTSGSSTKSSK